MDVNDKSGSSRYSGLTPRSNAHPPSQHSSPRQPAPSSPRPAPSQKSNKTGPRQPTCTLSITSVVAIAAAVVIAAFVIVVTYSSVQFSNTINSSVSDTINLALVGSMQLVRTPLQNSETLLARLKGEIDISPSTYATDDVGVTFQTNPTLPAFFTDATLVMLGRPEVTGMRQVRQSSRYMNGANPADIVGSVRASTTSIYPIFYYMFNNTLSTVRPANTSVLSNFSALSGNPSSFNVAGLSYVSEGYNVTGTKWSVAAYSPGYNIATTVLMTLSQELNPNPAGRRWALAIDHNMVAFGELMLQATAPFSIGTTNIHKVATSGAHTSLYAMREGLLIATSGSLLLNKSDTELWPAGQTPQSNLNSAYQTAASLCPTNTSCISSPATKTVDKTIISALRYSNAATELDIMIVCAIPRSYYFATADKSLTVTISVAIACCVINIAGCILLSLAIAPSLRHLQENMLLAAELKNDAVEQTVSRLSDIAQLSAVFDEMNQRLLIARSFVPEAVLLGQASTDMSEGDEDDEGTASVSRSVIESKDSKKNGGPVKRKSDTENFVWGDMGASKLSTMTPESGATPTATVNSSGRGEIAATLCVTSERRVAVLSMNLLGFNNLVGDRSAPRAQRIQDVTSRLLSVIVAAAQKERGVMDSFHGDHFILTFNASRAVAGSLAASIRTANVVGDEFRHDPILRNCIGVASGAAIGKAQIGTLGIDGFRRLSVVGAAYRAAIALQGVASQFLYKTPMRRGHVSGCVVDESAIKEIVDCGMYLQLVGRSVSGPSARRPEARHVYAAQYHGHTKADVEDDEWLYELDAIQSGDPYKDSNNALVALMDGDVQLCSQLLGAYRSTISQLGTSASVLTGSVVEHEVGSDFGGSESNLSGNMAGGAHAAFHPGWAVIEHYLHSDLTSNWGQPLWNHNLH